MDEATEPWGVQVERVEVKDVRVPEQLQRAMAAEAEAAREARAKVIYLSIHLSILRSIYIYLSIYPLLYLSNILPIYLSR